MTVEQISQRAGISVRTFFRYFPTRDDIMFALPHRLVDDTRVEVMATAITSVMWLAFLRWLSSDGMTPLATVVGNSFTVLAELDRPTPG